MRWASLLAVAMLGACAYPLEGMVNPTTGEVQTCTTHLPPGFSTWQIDRCMNRLKASGFVKAEALTAEQQAALESKGRRSPEAHGDQGSGGEESGAAEASNPAGTPKEGWRRVIMVPDTESIMVFGGEMVRYLGIRKLEGYQVPTAIGRAGEAVGFLRQFVDGQVVRLEYDGEARDPDGRAWAYVFLQDGRMVNALLVERGYARADPERTDLKYAPLFQQLEAAARAGGRGFWATR